VLERRFFAEATVHFGSVFVTSTTTMGSGDFSEGIAFAFFSKVGARKLRCGAVRLESPQAIAIRRIAAIAAGGVEVVSAD
jgi:hypothetical protein